MKPDFKWESVEQEKSYLALVKYLNDNSESRYDLTEHVRLLAAFFFQKDKDAHDYYVDLFSKQVEPLRNEIVSLRNQVKIMGACVEMITKALNAAPRVESPQFSDLNNREGFIKKPPEIKNGKDT